MIKWGKTSNIDSNTVTKHWVTYSILGTVIITMAFFGVCSPRNMNGGMELPSGTAGKVDGEKISSIEFRREYGNTTEQMRQQYRDNFDPVAMRLAPNVMDKLVGRLAIYKEAVKNGIWASDSEVDQIIIDGKYFRGEDGKFDPKLLDRYLKSQGHSEESFTEELRRNIVVQNFNKFLNSTTRVSDKVAELNYKIDESKADVQYLKLDPNTLPMTVPAADVDKYLAGADAKKVKDYFDQNKGEFNQEAKVKARHILISFKGARNVSGEGANRTKDEAKALATKIEGEVKKPGADFPALASKYTDEASGKAKGGDLGFFKKEQMVKEFAEAAFAMKPGQISGPVESPFGFHIIKVDTLQDAKAVTFEDAKRSIAEKLIAKERRPQMVTEKTKTLIEGLKAGKDETQALGLAWKDTGPFAMGSRSIPGLGSDPALMKAIATLKTPNQLYAEPIDVAGIKYILRLKSKQDADMTKLTPEKLKELSESSKYMDSYMLVSELNQDIVKRYDKAGKIYKNPEFLNYDQLLHGKKSEEN